MKTVEQAWREHGVDEDMPVHDFFLAGWDAAIDPAKRFCTQDNWNSVLDDPAPRAVRWASRALSRAFNDTDWGKWHYTEGNGAFTACGKAVVPFMVDGSPQEGNLQRITCKRCQSIIKHDGAHLLNSSGVLV